MKSFNRHILPTILFFMISHIVQSQDKFKVEIQLNSSNNDSLFLEVDNGIELKNYTIGNSPLILEDYYVSEYVSVQFFHPKKDGRPPNYELGVFLNSIHASVNVSIDKEGMPILSASQNIYPFIDMGAEEIVEYANVAFKNFWNFYNDNLAQLGQNDSITQKAFQLNKEYSLKVLEATEKLPVSYYSFWTFRRQIANNIDIPRDQKETIFHMKFDKFKNTYEYKHAEDLMFGSSIRIGEKLNNFSAPDIIDKSQFDLQLSEKPLLLMTWATWCSPCIHKVYLLQEIAQVFPNLNFVYIDMDSDIERARQFINDKNIIGHHLSYLDKRVPTSLTNLVSKIYLINQDMEVIYNYDLSPDPDFEILKSKLQELFP